jgi:2-polyprenyl-3-methyl-5-hydroxy-6-metoxy-1,4-benzoquinol methylase
VAKRILEAEVMDDLDLDEHLLTGALRGLQTINALSRSAEILWPTIRQFASRTGKTKLKVLDIATGAGDVPVALWKRAHRAGLQLELKGIDVNPKSLVYARRQAERLGAPIEFTQLNALQGQLPDGYDVVISSLFLHHLNEASAVQLLGKMAAATNHLVLVNDLRRHWWGLILAHVASRVLTRSPVVRVDAIRSVKAAFTTAEMKSLALAAGLHEAQVLNRWPCRFFMVWEKRQVQH